MNASTIRLCNALYAAGNNAGNGFAPAEETVDAAVEAYEAAGYEVLHTAATTDDVSVVRKGDDTIAIGGDAHGGNAWAVRIELDA